MGKSKKKSKFSGKKKAAKSKSAGSKTIVRHSAAPTHKARRVPGTQSFGEKATSLFSKPVIVQGSVGAVSAAASSAAFGWLVNTDVMKKQTWSSNAVFQIAGPIAIQGSLWFAAKKFAPKYKTGIAYGLWFTVAIGVVSQVLSWIRDAMKPKLQGMGALPAGATQRQLAGMPTGAAAPRVPVPMRLAR